MPARLVAPPVRRAAGAAMKEQAPGEWVLESPLPRLLAVQFHITASSLGWLLLAMQSTTGALMLLLSLLLVAYSVYAWYALAIAVLRRGRPVRIELAMRELRLPSRLLPGSTRVIPLAQVRGVEVTRGLRQSVIVSAGNGMPAWIGGSWFRSADECHRFVELLAGRCGRGVAIAHRMRLWATVSALAVVAMLVLYALSRLLTVTPELSLLAVGALNAALVADGDWFRLVMSPFVHASLLHLAVVAGMLWLLANDVEARLGVVATAWILLVAGGMGAGASVLVGDAFAFGGGALGLGLLAAHVVLWLADRTQAPPRLRAFPGWLPGVLLLAELVLNPTSYAMRLGGLAGGAIGTVVILLLLRRPKALLTITLAGLLCAATGVATWAISGMPAALALDTALRLVTSERASADEANLGAWLIASSPAAGTELLATTRQRFAPRAGNLASAEFQDTLATLHFRLGDGAQAVAIESVLVDREPNAAYATQLARFSRLAGERVRDSAVAVTREAGDRLCLAANADGSLEVDVIGVDGERIVGLLRVLGVGANTCVATPAGWPATTTYEAGRVAQGSPGIAETVRVFRADADILALP